MPVEPEPSRWALRPPPPQDDGEDLIAVGADLAPGTVLAAYRLGLFPMGLGDGGEGPIGWWSPDPRGVLLPGAMHVSRSLRRSARSMTTTVDTAFGDVVRACADPTRHGRWITPAVVAAYTELHELGWAHSVEVWSGDELAGGLYGLAIGGLFAGESMFYRHTDASKAALVALAERWFADGDGRRLIDVQWRTSHLASLGVVQWPRARYVAALPEALAVPSLTW